MAIIAKEPNGRVAVKQAADPLDRTILPIPPQRKPGEIGPPLQPVTHDGALFGNPDAIKHVGEFVPASTGQRYLPHVTLGRQPGLCRGAAGRAVRQVCLQRREYRDLSARKLHHGSQKTVGLEATMTADHSLPSWNDGAAKSAILDFIARVTKQGGADFVPPAERIATFDNGGTLLCEQPLQAQVFFLIDRVKELAAKDPRTKERQPFKALLEHDYKTLCGLGRQALFELAFTTHAGVTDEEFERIAHGWLATARHPKFGRLFKECTYRPQVELLDYLRENGFKTYIVSGGGVNFVRAFAEEAYGIPREQVIGSSVRAWFAIKDKRVVLRTVAEFNSFDDREAKPQNIGLHIGRRPILAFGNSDGDLAMLRYTKAGTGLRLALLIHHDDAEREVAYDREFRLSPLTEALDKADQYGITVVSMKRDWKAVFADD
jgi:phosphoglycolate phosphatase-like HAD superfamily hydrolase